MKLTPEQQELRRKRNRDFAIVGIGHLLMLPALLWVGKIDGSQFVYLYQFALGAYVLGQAIAGFQRG